jgi:glycosyltransferase involved in cell wall biosynthesis
VKVVFLLTQDRGGPVDLTVGLAQELAGRAGGPEVTILGPTPVSSAGLPTSLLRTVQVGSKADARGFAAVSKWLNKLAPDIIHAQDRRAGLVSLLVAGGKAPLVQTFHGVPDNAAGRWVQAGPFHGRRPGVSGGSRLVADALVARRIGCTVTPSQAMAEFLVRELRVPAGRLRVLPNGVAIPGSGRQVTGVHTIATVGKFVPCKAMPVLVEAFTSMAAGRDGLRLRMVGDGPERPRCEELARQAPGGGANIEFTGYRTDVDAQLERADVFVLPSLNENLPLALLQAMAMGLPCIASAVGGVPELLDAGCGILVTPGDAGSLRAAMERMITEPGLAARLGAAARRRVAEQYSLSRCADSHLRLWSEIIENGRR